MVEQIRYFLKHGFWKLSEELASTKESRSVDPKLRTDFKELLWAIASEPASNQYLCADFSSIWDQSWFATSAMRRLPSSETESLASITELDAVRLEAEFKITLMIILLELPSNQDSIFQELTHLFGQVIQADKVKHPAQCLSTESHHFLCTSFLKNPTRTNAVVQKLLCLWCCHFNGTDNELQGIYKEILWHCIQTLENENENNKNDTSVALFNTLFSIISLLKVSEEKEQILLEWLCPRLVYLFESKILSRHLAHLAFLSRVKPTWLRYLNSVEDEHYERNVDRKDVAVLERICSRLVDSDGNINIKEIFHRAVTSKIHFIEDILDLNSELLMHGSKEVVFNCISHPFLNKLWPLMILDSWSRFSNRDEIFTTLNALVKKYKVISKDPVYTRLCIMLEGHLKVVEWCKKNKRGKPTSNSDMLMLAKDHSTLEVMHRTTNLAEVDWLQVGHILEHNYVLYTSELVQTESSPAPGQWDVITFNAFCILMLAFKAILSAMEIQTLCKKIYKSHESSKKAVKPIIPSYFANTYPSVVLHHPSLEKCGQYSDEKIVQMAYTEQVTKRLQSMKQMLCNLHPVNFRIEILENIFSLLFVRYKDLKEDILSDSAGEDDDVVNSPDKSPSVDKSILDMSESFVADEDQSKMATSSFSGFSFPEAMSVSPQLRTIPLIVAQACSVKSNFDLPEPRNSEKSATTNRSRSQTNDQVLKSTNQNASFSADLSHKTQLDNSPSSSLGVTYVDAALYKKSLESSSNTCNLSSDQTAVPESSVLNVSQTEQEKSEPKPTERPRLPSTATSVASVAGKTGFICNEFLVRDVLDCLKECLVDTNAAYYSSLSQDKKEGSDPVPSTIAPESVKQSMTRLSQHVSEAAWRLQLLTDMNFTTKVGIVSSAEFRRISVPSQSEFIYPTEESESESEEEKDSAGTSEKMKTRRISLRKSETDKSSESGSHSTTTGGGSASGSSYRKTRRSKAKLHRHTLLPASTSTVNLLLSSPPSLVSRCLGKGDVVQAQRVIKMCGLEDTSLAVEVKFTDAYQTLRHNLKVRSASNEAEHRAIFPAFSQQQQNVVKPSSTFQAIKRAAAAGVQSVAFMGDVESFLSVTSLPGIPGVSTVVKEFPHSSNVLRAADNNAAMAAVDLALTIGTTHQHSVSLLDVAIKHCSALQVAPSSSATTANQKALGFINFTHQMIHLMKEVNQETSEEDTSSSPTLFPRNVSLSKILTSGQFPLRKKVFTEHLSFWNSLQTTVNDFQAALVDEKNKLSQVPDKEGDSMQKTKMTSHMSFKKLLNTSRVLPLKKDSTKRKETKDGVSKEESHYMEQLYIYLKLLTSLVVQNLPSDKGSLGPKTYFDILSERPADLIGQLVFEHGVPPAKLEPIANSIRLDLAYNVVRNCCPRIPAVLPSTTLSCTRSGSVVSWGRVVLNQMQEQWTDAVRHPEVAVRTLLSDLLETLQQRNDADSALLTLDRDQAASLAVDPAVTSILTETQELSAVDLTLLSAGDETLAFYANLSNLMWIHSLVSLETTVVSEEDEENGCGETLGLLSACPLERLLAQMSVGYNLGQLGFVSLFDLQNHLIGEFPPRYAVSALIPTNQSDEKRFWDVLTKSTDPRVLFRLTNGQRFSPKVQVLYVENVDSQLDNSMVEFFNNSVRFDGEGRLVIPERLGWYRENVMENQEPESQTVEQTEDVADVSVEAKENLTSLVDFLRDNTSGHLQARLVSSAHNIKTDLTVIVEEQLVEFGVTFEYPHLGQESVNKVDRSKPAIEDIWASRTITEPVIKFLERHCWLLSVLVRKIHQDEELNVTPAVSYNSDNRTQCLEQLVRSNSVDKLKSMYGDNVAVAALHLQPTKQNLWHWLDKLVNEHNWTACLDVLCAVPKNQLMLDSKLQKFNDGIAFELASNLPSEDHPTPWQYCVHIGDISLQASCVLRNLHHWPGPSCEQVLRVLLDDSRRRLSQNTRNQLEQMLHEVQIYQQILVCCTDIDSAKTWFDIRTLSKNSPSTILKNLIGVKECKLCLAWAELQHVSTRAQHMVDSRFLMLLLDTYPSDFSAASKLLHSVLAIQAVAVCEDLLHQLKSISSLGFVVNFLLDSCSSVLGSEDLLRYRHLSIGIQMLSLVPAKEQVEYMDLAHQPWLIVEQLVMITRLDVLERMLDTVRPMLTPLPLASLMSLNSIDGLLRRYAEKALDFRVIHAQLTPCPSDSDEKLLMSLSMGSNCSEEFVMPVNVPTKDQWVPNDAVTECMCCDAVAFSMFNRRHHCRRCGRVICGSCSTHRIKVPTYEAVDVRVCDACHYYMQFDAEQQVGGYGEVAVRVCDNCHGSTDNVPHDSDQSSVASSRENQSTSLQSSFNSFSRDSPWRLSLNESHNATVREEFAYEHAPSVSLCLAVLKLHSEQTAYPRFLLDSCDRMLQLLQPVRPGMLNREVDHGLVIRMVRALIVAAKVKYARSGLNTGVAHCDQLLSQADLLSELVRSDCSFLIPGEALSGHALRRLRDRLVEEELWSLAMDVSTKGGLDRTGVWAAWGKAALRSGRWEEARQKFSHCLEKASEAPRPVRNPPLLKEIIHILETGAYAVDQSVLQQAAKIQALKSKESISTPVPSPALTILHTLASLKDVAQGRYPQSLAPSNMVIIGPKLDPLFYEECQYYLNTYGSHAGILAFYLGHDDLAATLRHVLKQQVDPTVFFEHVYIPCLRRGAITTLHHDLQALDPSLELWKVYLCYTCRHLERLGFLNVLYQVQLYMKDYVRAAMTCIRFYRSGARSYTDLAINVDHLHTAHKHLEAELSDSQWGVTGRRERLSSSGSLLPMNLEPRDVDRHINTVSRQIEVTKFLHKCETESRPVLQLIPEVFDHLSAAGDEKQEPVPTLFGSNSERVQLAVLLILSGKNVEEGFGTSFQIIQDYHLKASQVYSLAGKKLSSDGRLSDVEQLIRCVKTSGMPNTSAVCDEVLTVCVRVRADKSEPGDIEPLVKLISDTGNKVTAYIDCRQLKAAYLLAVKFNRLGDVRKILREAERLGQTVIRSICLKKLSQQQPSSAQTT